MKNKEHLAHIRDDGDRGWVIQTLKEHVEGTAQFTADDLRQLGTYGEDANTSLEHCGRIMGLLHDMGKAKDSYDLYLWNSVKGLDTDRVIHSFQGAVWLWEHYHQGNNTKDERIACEVLSYAIASHHGLFDIASPTDDLLETDGYRHRIAACMEKLPGYSNVEYDQCVEDFFKTCISIDTVRQLMEAAVAEIKEFMNSIRLYTQGPYKEQRHFAFGLLIRLLTSALMDGDRKDTAIFMKTRVEEETHGTQELWMRQSEHISGIRFPNSESEINRSRAEISNQCHKFAEYPGGIYRLSVPTGSGKTLAAARYAFKHAACFRKKRIFFVSPYLSILDQNAKVIRNAVSDQSIIVEHHSNIAASAFEPDKNDKSKENSDYITEQMRYDTLISDWHHPIVITTLVQMLYTMFEGKTTCVRRFQALTNSIIIFDEVQSIPNEMLSIFNATLNFLAYTCNTTVILCSATQPNFELIPKQIRFNSPVDMVPYEKKLWGVYKRTRIIYRKEPMEIKELAIFSADLMNQVDSLLIVCNTKGEALQLFKQIELLHAYPEQPFVVYHLSTAMCKQHRNDVIACIKERLHKERMVVVSTQIIEAGVDLSFESAIRLMAGLDNIAQTAGRCNRSNDYGMICNVYGIQVKDEKLKHLNSIQQSKDAAISFFSNISEVNDSQEDCLTPKAIHDYYQLLYASQTVKAEFDYPIKAKECGLNTSLFNLLSSNAIVMQNGDVSDTLAHYKFHQAFATAGRLFKVFDEDTVDVIVPYNERAKEIIANLCSDRAAHDYQFLKTNMDEASEYCISLRKYKIDQLADLGALEQPKSKLFIAIREKPEYYNPRYGLDDDIETCFV